MNPRTKQNLHTAMQAEALAYAKFARFAAAARMHEDVGLATLFQQSADVDRCHHFAQQAELAGIVGSSDDNLANAIEQTIHQIAMYEIFTRQAAQLTEINSSKPTSRTFAKIIWLSWWRFEQR